MEIYDFDKKINRLGTKSYKWDLMGEEYIPLWVADTDFEVPPAVTKRLTDRINHGLYGYLLTGNEVYDAITGWFDRICSVKIPGKSWIKLVPGIVPALAVCSNYVPKTLGKGCKDNEDCKKRCEVLGDKVYKPLACTPNYSMLLEAPDTAGNKMLRVPLKNDDEDYSIDFEALQAAVTEDTHVFYLCNPHNPVGRVYSFEELKKVSEFAKKNNLIVVSDEVHCEVVFEGKHIPFFAVDDYAREHSICLYSNGKLCNLADLILSFAVIPNDELRAEFERLGYAFGEEHILNVEAGTASFAECDEWKKQLLEYLKGNRDYLESELKRRFPKVRMPHLQSTYLQWADFRGYGEEITAKFFMDNAKVFVSDGADFDGPGYVRINFATQREVLSKALDRMERALNEYISKRREKNADR